MTVMAVRGDGTVRVGLDGTGWEIDRTAGRARALRDSLARCVAAARQAGRQAAAGGRDGLGAGPR